MTHEPDFSAMRATVHDIVMHEAQEPVRAWTIQGFGMLRCYFGASDQYRLNVWDPHLTVPNVSLVHDHPWDFRSWVLAGVLYNLRFSEHPPLLDVVSPPAQGLSGLYDWTTIKTGPKGGQTKDEVQTVYLKTMKDEPYQVGDTYSQKAHEIHMTHYRVGTVTLNDRTNRNGENARVFWQHSTPWVDAKPRVATDEEVKRTLALALDQFEQQPTARVA